MPQLRWEVAECGTPIVEVAEVIPRREASGIPSPPPHDQGPARSREAEKEREMTKRALLVGLNDYGKVAPRLEAPVDEVRRWSNLLTGVYQFDPRHIITSVDRPTRASVISDLRTLLGKAQLGDQIVFGFFGHGSLVEGHDENGLPNGIQEEGLVLYNNASTSIQDAAFSSSDLVSLLKARQLPAGTAFTVLLDCCFAGRFGEAEGKRSLAVSNSNGNGNGKGAQKVTQKSASRKSLSPSTAAGNARLHRFAWIKTPTAAEAALALPIIVAASNEAETAYQVKDRLLFSRQALGELAVNGSESYDRFISKINPLESGIPQHASLTGDLTRSSRPFLS